MQHLDINPYTRNNHSNLNFHYVDDLHKQAFEKYSPNVTNLVHTMLTIHSYGHHQSQNLPLNH